jgi:hypothetical protein
MFECRGGAESSDGANFVSRNTDYLDGYYAEQARQVAKSLNRDNAKKQRIIERSPQAFYGMDADELGTASAVELATRELKELGITSKASDPIELLDAHHAGRQYERAKGGNRNFARDVSEDSLVGRYLKSEETSS